MSEQAHTPGPWRVDRLKEINNETVIRGGGEVGFICMVVGPNHAYPVNTHTH